MAASFDAPYKVILSDWWFPAIMPAEQGENPMGGGLSGRMIDL